MSTPQLEVSPLHLELDGCGPLHAQITRALRSRLGTSFPPGARLPSSRELARDLGVSRNTVVAAYEQLLAEGAIESRVASGFFAAGFAAGFADAAAGSADAGAPARTDTTLHEPQSRYARRSRRFHNPHDVSCHHGARYRFDCGTPSTNPALTTAWARELARAATYTPSCSPGPQGLPALRVAICDYLSRRRGVVATPDDILVVGGTQQAIALTARIILDEGDEVAIEEPHYFATRQVLLVNGAQLQGIPVDAEGLVCEALPASPPRMICVTPSHQFPSGAVMSLPRRHALLEYAHRHRCWIFEDDYDGEFRHLAKPLPPLQALDGGQRVIYVGTFSKAMFPGLRLGYLVMPPALREDFIAAKWAHDLSGPAIEQAALASFIANGGFDRHMRRSAEALRARRDALVAGLREHAGDRIRIVGAHAGMHLLVWLRGMSRAQGDAFRARARELGLGIPSVAPEYLSPPDRAGILLKYAGVSLQEIREAMPLFARCLDEFESPRADYHAAAAALAATAELTPP
jgi:GntR family transcriptional regulator/MocR family aminotransferase